MLVLRHGAFKYELENFFKSDKTKKRTSKVSKRVTPDVIIDMNSLYAKYGHYAEVGREIGLSGSNVARYAEMEGTPKIVVHTFRETIGA